MQRNQINTNTDLRNMVLNPLCGWELAVSTCEALFSISCTNLCSAYILTAYTICLDLQEIQLLTCLN